MRLSPWLPFFHDSFIDYGFNHIEHFENLRLKGAKFYIIEGSFLVDIPHDA